ncbi:MAG TPA: hypothetical protein ENN88_03125 [Candidatus Coatesbacteria bacterium]|nr:hypothetical protein [Candidatus Coatesbacteria bacterium]
MPLFRRKVKKLAAPSMGRPRSVNLRPAPFAWDSPSGSPSLAVLRRMRRLGLVAACLNVIKGPVVAAEWDVKDPDDGLVRELLDQLQPLWRRLASRALTCLDFGYAGFELVYETDGGVRLAETRALEPGAIEPLLDEVGRPVGLRWRGPDGTEELDAAKSLWLVHGGEFGDPWGESHLTPAWPFWQALTYAVVYGNRWLERHALPPAVVRYPAELAVDAEGKPVPANETRALELAKRINSEHPAVALPQPDEPGRPGWEIELLAGAADVGPLLDWVAYLSRMLVTSLFVPEKALYQEGDRGSLSLVSEQVNTFLLTLDGIARELAEQVSAGLLEPLSTLLGRPEARPRLVIASLAGSRRELYKELLLELLREGKIGVAVEQIAEELGLSVTEAGSNKT